jgi:hypothetical protein
MKQLLTLLLLLLPMLAVGATDGVLQTEGRDSVQSNITVSGLARMLL